MSGVAIRPMRTEDLDEVSRVICASFRYGAQRDGFSENEIQAYFRQRGSAECIAKRMPECRFMVACLSERIVGVVGTIGCDIDVLYVDPDCLNRDVGTALFHAAEKWLTKSGHKELTLDSVLPSNLGFYAKMGAERCGEKISSREHCKGRRVVLMRKRLSVS